MGGGGGVRVNCLLGMKVGVVLLSLLMDSFPALLLAWVLGAMFCLCSKLSACAGVPGEAFPAFAGW